MTGTAIYWLLFAVAVLTAYAIHVGIQRETRRAARLWLLTEQRAARVAEDFYWSNDRLEAFTAAILITAQANPERIEELMAS